MATSCPPALTAGPPAHRGCPPRPRGVGAAGVGSRASCREDQGRARLSHVPIIPSFRSKELAGKSPRGVGKRAWTLAVQRCREGLACVVEAAAVAARGRPPCPRGWAPRPGRLPWLLAHGAGPLPLPWDHPRRPRIPGGRGGLETTARRSVPWPLCGRGPSVPWFPLFPGLRARDAHVAFKPGGYNLSVRTQDFEAQLIHGMPRVRMSPWLLVT